MKFYCAPIALTFDIDSYPVIDAEMSPRPIVPSAAVVKALAPTAEILHAKNDAYILSYTRELSGITGLLTDESRLPRQSNSPSANIGAAAYDYLAAHGYSQDAQAAIENAYERFGSQEAFAAFLCGKGMAKSEADWLWRHIANHL